MPKIKKGWLYYLPRILAIILVVFWFLFVTLSHGFSATALIESIVWIVILVITLISWRNGVIGGILFILLGLFYTIMAFGKFPYINYLFTSAPLILTGILFLLQNIKR